MKTPRVEPTAVRIVVQPPDGPVVRAVSRKLLSDSEAWQLVKGIRPRFAWVLEASESAPSDRDLDTFLMMYGKAIKERSNTAQQRTGTES